MLLQMEGMVLNQPYKQVNRPDAAAFLAQPASVRYIKPFLGRECSVKEAAQELNISMSGMMYWLEKMLALELIEVTRIEERRGRPIKHYRAVAKEFFVPFVLTRAGTHEEMLHEWEKPQHDALLKGIAKARGDHMAQWGILHSRPESGVLRSVFTALEGHQEVSPSGPPVLSGWITAHLTPEQAKVFQQRMMEILKDMTLLGEAGEGDPYVMHVGLAPRPEH